MPALNLENATNAELLDAAAEWAARIESLNVGVPHAVSILATAMYVAAIIVEESPHGTPCDLALADMTRIRMFLDELLQNVRALRANSLYTPTSEVH